MAPYLAEERHCSMFLMLPRPIPTKGNNDSHSYLEALYSEISKNCSQNNLKNSPLNVFTVSDVKTYHCCKIIRFWCSKHRGLFVCLIFFLKGWFNYSISVFFFFIYSVWAMEEPRELMVQYEKPPFRLVTSTDIWAWWITFLWLIILTALTESSDECQLMWTDKRLDRSISSHLSPRQSASLKLRRDSSVISPPWTDTDLHPDFPAPGGKIARDRVFVHVLVLLRWKHTTRS